MAVRYNPVAATASVIVNGLSDVGLDALVGPHPAYVNVTREFLLGVPSLPLAPERVVLELLEDQELDGALLDALRTLVNAGFTIALDDFQYSPEQEPLLELATIAKLDVRALSPERLAHDAALLKGRGLRLVAEKVETYEEAAYCKALGFHAFQGYYFARPALVHGRPLPSTQITTLCRLLETGTEVDIDEARDDHRVRPRPQPAAAAPEQLGSAQPRDAASVRCGTRSRCCGTRAIRRNATRRILPRVVRRCFTCGAGTALVRARIAQQLALTVACPDRAFTVGLFSLLGALVRQPLPELLAQLPFDERTTAALLQGDAPEGRLLGAIVAHERGEELPDGFPSRRVARCYRAATSWSDSLSAALA